MKYKIILIIICAVLLTGCSKEKDEENSLKCDIGNTTITLTFKKGKIIKYVDKIQGDLDKDEIDELNNAYLNEVDDNSSAITILRGVIASNGGDCK